MSMEGGVEVVEGVQGRKCREVSQEIPGSIMEVSFQWEPEENWKNGENSEAQRKRRCLEARMVQAGARRRNA